MIYGPTKREVKLLRTATLEDFIRDRGQTPDTQDQMNLASCAYVVVEERGREKLYLMFALASTKGFNEVVKAIHNLYRREGKI